MNDRSRASVLEDAAVRRRLAQDRATADAGVPRGGFVTIDGEELYRIAAFDRMPPFLMNLPTDTDLWMFLSSFGGLTAGRRHPDGALFPYETVDKLHDAHYHTGPITLVRWQRGGRASVLWQPFAFTEPTPPAIERSLAKNTIGNRVVFEEIDRAAQLAFRYAWTGSDDTGWVRTATLENLGADPVHVALLDGLRNLLPSGAPLRLYQQSSCLVDAYKRADLDPGTRLAIFSLTSRITDRPEPAEMLRATTVWCYGLADFEVTLAADALGAFRRGEPVAPQTVLTGRRGNYLVHSRLTLAPGARAQWHLAADTERSHLDIARLITRLAQPDGVAPWLAASLASAGENLQRIVGSADGIQLTGRPVVSAHHFANVLYNNLRGGVFVDGYGFPKDDFVAFLEARRHGMAALHAGLLARLPATPVLSDLLGATATAGDPNLERLAYEYLPLYFGRRHGDPSRPWNRFEIAVRNPDGSQALRYEGNWRDVFQNWEALARSFPAFLPGVIAKFVNASTVDGFNPYRITRDGIDWEVPDPDDPWAGIGYWGDHQIVYLLRLLESMRRHSPGGLRVLLEREIFSYADVPYRLAPYAEMLRHPRATITFDTARAAIVARRVAAEGQDGRLVHAPDGTIRHATLLEKLVVPALAKLGSLVPGGGIWMNTERPEWNDANNALVGGGVSVVTLCYLRRYLEFVADLVGDDPAREYPVTAEVTSWLRHVRDVFERHPAPDPGDARARKRLMDQLGTAFSSYRERVYAEGLSATTPLGAGEVLAWCRSAGAHLDSSIRANRRDDGLYHAYNLLEIAPDGERVTLQPLDVMLEGQVAALGSGLVGAPEAVALLDRLFASPLFCADQNSFLLYPDHPLPTFLERNRIPEAAAAAVPLLGALLAAGDDSIVARDAAGVLRFHADFANAHDVTAALDRLARRAPWTAPVGRDRQAVVDLFVEVFHHRRYTGRSGSMYAYEGLGCVYWHMVSKLLLAVQEVALDAHDRGEAPEVCDALAAHYHRIRAGLGYEKSAGDYGAFPADPYSHTPAHAGAQQPGMTGLVKEEILARFGELGVRVRDGIVEFDPVLLRRDEFLAEPGSYRYFDVAGRARTLDVPRAALAFSYCQVPVRYVLTTGEAWVRVTSARGAVTEHEGRWLDAEASRSLIGRLGTLASIEVGVPEPRLCGAGSGATGN